MKDIKDIVFIVNARLNSSRLPNKMIKDFNGTNLLSIAIEKILKSKIIPKEQFYLSLYDKELIDIAKKYNCNVFHRSSNSVSSASETEKSLQILFITIYKI